MDKQRLSREELRELCIKHGWFTEGTNRQYDKLFYINDKGWDIEDVVTIIWVCSDVEKWSWMKIYNVLDKELEKHERMESQQ